MASETVIEIWTDGGCKPNPGPGGWAAILRFGEHERELTGGEPETTNNRMELTAAIMALEALKKPCIVALHTDMSGALDQKGIAVTLIHAGSHKIDANPYQPLPEAVHDQMQRELEVVRFLFAETVAAGRGDRLTQAAALATEKKK